MQISVDFKTIDPNFTEEMIISGEFGTNCFEEVNGYENKNCCESTKAPTETATNHPRYFPFNKPSPLLGSVPIKFSTYEPT